MTRRASIDIGTNSTRLLIADIDQHQRINTLSYAERITRLGSDKKPDGTLNEDSIERVIKVLMKYKEQIDKNQVQNINVFATSAARDASNKDTLVRRIADAGFECRILTGTEEAELAFRGAMSDMPQHGHNLVCDIGGGSTEFITSVNGEIESTQSVDIGSRRLTQLYLHSDPPKVSEINEFLQHVENELSQNHWPDFSLDRLVVLGGTAFTLALMDAETDISHPERAHHYQLELSSLHRLIEVMTGRPESSRKELTGLHPERADTINAGALILQAIMKKVGIQKTTISLRDALYGILVK